MNQILYDSFLQLIRLGIGHQGGAISNDIDWNAIEALAEKQGLLAVILDGIDKLNTNQPYCTNTLPLELKLEWIGDVLQNYEQLYVEYKKAIGSLARFYNRHGFKMMVLKGYACSLDWPKPEHRPCGDIDIWQFERQKEADEVLSNTDFTDYTDKEMNTNCTDGTNQIEIDNSHHHHTVFKWSGFSVENHYDFINVYHHKSHLALEKTFKELAQDDSRFVDLYGEKVYLPSPNLHALFLMKHAALHFSSTELTLRQMLDWAFFVERHGKEVDWDWLLGLLEEHGMSPFFNIVNAICVEDLGFDASMFPSVQYVPSQKDAVLNEIFTYVFEDDVTSNFVMRQVHRFQRWHGNGWKHELCYKESMWSAFWSGVWGHLLKPASI